MTENEAKQFLGIVTEFMLKNKLTLINKDMPAAEVKMRIASYLRSVAQELHPGN